MRTTSSLLLPLPLILALATAFCLAASAHAEQAAAGKADIPRTGLVLWLSADDVQLEGDVVARWNDRSGNGNHALHERDAKNVLANPCVAKDAASGQPVLRFSGAYSSFSFKEITTIRTVFWVVSKDAKACKQKLERFVLGGAKSLDFHPGTHFTDTILHATTKYGSPALQQGYAWLNGSPIDPRATDFPQSLAVITLLPTAAVKADQIAKDRQFPDRCWWGDIAEIILYDTGLADTERQSVEKYLLGKYALQPPAGGGAERKPADGK